MKRDERKKFELQKASNALHYEIWMLLSLARDLSTGGAGQSVIINNALLESFVIHARVLLDFLYAEKPYKDDIIAEDFLSDPGQWSKERKPKTDLLGTVHSRVGKEAAHLTYARLELTSETKQWPFMQIAEEIKLVFDQFLESVPLPLLGSRWEEQ